VFEAERTWSGAQALPRIGGIGRVLDKVGRIREEANAAHSLVEEAQAEVQKTLRYMSAKDTKVEDWLGRWSSFLEQLAQAFERVKAARAGGTNSKDAKTAALQSHGMKLLDADRPLTSSAPPQVPSPPGMSEPMSEPAGGRPETAPTSQQQPTAYVGVPTLSPAPLTPSVLQPRQPVYAEDDVRIEDVFRSMKSGHATKREAAPVAEIKHRRNPRAVYEMEDKENRP